MPPARVRYLAEIAETVRDYHAWAKSRRRSRASASNCCDASDARRVMRCEAADQRGAVTSPHRGADQRRVTSDAERRRATLDALIAERDAALDAAREEAARHVAEDQGRLRRRRVRREGPRQGDPHDASSTRRCRARKIRKVALPRYEDEGEILRWLLRENVPGSFPFTAGVFAFKREDEDPTRMFAGEGDAFRTNRRFHLLADGMPAKRLSTAFDSVTLYGFDPDRRPDIYGKVGNSGVSIATLDDMKVLYSGFDLCDSERPRSR